MAEIAVVIPHHKDRLTLDERVSLATALRVYGDSYDRYFVLPRGRFIPLAGFRHAHFDARYFQCRDCYSALMTSDGFYRRFEKYEYILIFQLDCLALRNDLADWCAKGYDYVGAPWLRDVWKEEYDWHDRDAVGNGGFSLRRVRAFRRVLRMRRPAPAARLRHAANIAVRTSLFTARLAKRAVLGHLKGDYSDVLRPHHHYSYLHEGTEFEDQFWSLRAPRIDPSFRIAPVDEALAFSFERGAGYSFERSGRRLPSGCHAWNRWPEDRRFWEAHADLPPPVDLPPDHRAAPGPAL